MSGDNSKSGPTGKLIVVSAEWCGPCKVLKQSLGGLLAVAGLADMDVVILDIDSDEEAVEPLDVTRLPTSIFTAGGVEKERHIGVKEVDTFLHRCKAHLTLDNAFA